MKLALQELGYENVYHFFRMPHHSSHPALWIGALEAKYEHKDGNPEKQPIANWDDILGDYSVSVSFLIDLMLRLESFN